MRKKITTHPGFKYINAKNFFPNYASKVKNFKHKLRGKDGNNMPIAFTETDLTAICEGIAKMCKDFFESTK